jgi:hypothetical protein
MNTRIAIVTAIVSLLSTAAGCARPDVVPAAASAHPIVAYGVSAERSASAQSARPARFELATPRPERVVRLETGKR